MDALHQQVNDVMGVLFRRHPALCGFAVQEDLSFGNVACHPILLGEEAQCLHEEISAALQEILEERPEAAEFLRGRTLARMFH